MTFSLVLLNLFLIFCLFFHITPEQAKEALASKAPTPTLPPQIRTFNSSLHPEFGNLRTLTIDGEPWFVGKDVAEALGYSNGRDALSRHVDKDDKTTVVIPDSGSNYKSKAVLINESDLYSLILSSKLEKAKEFKRWVTAEVLPTIRKTGGYISLWVRM